MVKCSRDIAGHASGAMERQNDSGWYDRPTRKDVWASGEQRLVSLTTPPDFNWSEKAGPPPQLRILSSLMLLLLSEAGAAGKDADDELVDDLAAACAAGGAGCGLMD